LASTNQNKLNNLKIKCRVSRDLNLETSKHYPIGSHNLKLDAATSHAKIKSRSKNILIALKLGVDHYTFRSLDPN
jgi:hypothetical protein